MEAHLFTYPEQLAIVKVLELIREEKICIVNFGFFSRVESSPLVRIEKPPLARLEYPHIPTWYLETTVKFWCRGEEIAAAVVQGSVILPRKDDRPSGLWGIAEVRGRKHYWRNDPGESHEWQCHPGSGPDSGIKWGSDLDQEAFDIAIRLALNL